MEPGVAQVGMIAVGMSLMIFVICEFFLNVDGGDRLHIWDEAGRCLLLAFQSRSKSPCQRQPVKWMFTYYSIKDLIGIVTLDFVAAWTMNEGNTRIASLFCVQKKLPCIDKCSV